MISRDSFTELYDYNWWARDRQLDACAALTPEQFVRPVGGSFAALRDTLAHLVGVEWLYLERWSGRAPRALPSAEEFPTLEPLRARWGEVERDCRSVLASVTDARLAAAITYTNMKGESKSFPLWKVFYHLLNHQSYHRGQVTTQLRLLGAAPAPVDYGRWLDARKEEPNAPAIPLGAWKELFAYNHWARDRQLAAAAQVSPENFLRPLGSSFSSLRDTLVHLAASEWVWLSAWRRGRSTTPEEREQFAPEKFPSVEAIRERWAEVERDLGDYLAGLSDDAPGRPFSYSRQGQTLTFALWRLFYHLLNHQSYHRGQVTTQLRQLGAAPPQVDYYFWLSARQ